MAKVEATRNYGGRIELVGSHFEESVEAAIAHAEETGATFLHAFEDEHVIAGQGTIGLELHDQLDRVGEVDPDRRRRARVGVALALRSLRPDVRLIGVQAAECAPFAGATEHGFTIAEGIMVKEPGQLTRRLLDGLLDDVVTVTDEEISQAIVFLLERMKLVVEGAGAATVAALLAGRIEGSGPAVALLSGGNIDATLLISVMRTGSRSRAAISSSGHALPTDRAS